MILLIFCILKAKEKDVDKNDQSINQKNNSYTSRKNLNLTKIRAELKGIANSSSATSGNGYKKNNFVNSKKDEQIYSFDFTDSNDFWEEDFEYNSTLIGDSHLSLTDREPDTTSL